MFQSYFSDGDEMEENPVPGNRYWVVVKVKNVVEMAFEAMLTISVSREHKVDPDDTTPSYQFDNGVIVHGHGIKFFTKTPDKPLKSLRFCTVYRKSDQDKYELFGLSDVTAEIPEKDKQFKTLDELRTFLKSLGAGAETIPAKDFTGQQEFELML